MLEKLFHLAEAGTSVRKEILAGITIFFTMSYVIFVQPAVLSTDFAGQPTGLDFHAVLLATCVSAALASLIMGLYANYPIALAPGMGENFVFVSTIMSLSALGYENAWQTALGVIFISGIIFLVLSAFRIREAIIDSVSPSIRSGIAVGIGVFIAFIGLKNAGLIIDAPGTLVGLNTKFFSPDMGVFFFGLLVTAILHSCRIGGSVLIGIISAAVLAIVTGQASLPAAIMGLPAIESSAFFKMNIKCPLLLCLCSWTCLTPWARSSG